MSKFKPRYNQNVNLTIRSLGMNGEGIGYWHKHTLFVDHTLPGEVVRGRIVECGKKYSKVRADSLSYVSPHRTNPPCKYFKECGGCQLMHLDYPEQLVFKQQRIKNLLEKIAGITDIEIAPCQPSPKPLQYRNKILLPAGRTSESLKLGLYARNSHELIEIRECLVHCELGEKIYRKIYPVLEASKIVPYDHNTASGELRFLLIKTAESTDQVLVTLVMNSYRPEIVKELAEKLRKDCPEVRGVVLNINNDPGNTALGTSFETLSGEGFIEEVILGKKYRVSPASFFQVNLKQAENIYSKVIELSQLSGDETVLDAYCGVGTLALSLAPFSRQVIGVECVPQAIQDATLNAEINSITNASFVCDAAENYVKTIRELDAAILNPPRKGCDPIFLEELARIKPKRLIYISCDPATLARDLAILCKYEYNIECILPYDMFPQTSHVECVVKLILKT